MKPFNAGSERTSPTWFFRIASVVAILVTIAAIGVFVRDGNTTAAILLIVATPVLAVALSWSWTGLLFSPFEWARRYVAGVEGDHRHEWYAFKGQRVRVFLDATQQPWFALSEIAHILALKVDGTTFRNYRPHEFGVPATASERCLSETGLRRLIKYSAHPDAGPLVVWLERDVLRVLRRRNELQSADSQNR